MDTNSTRPPFHDYAGALRRQRKRTTKHLLGCLFLLGILLIITYILVSRFITWVGPH